MSKKYKTIKKTVGYIEKVNIGNFQTADVVCISEITPEDGVSIEEATKAAYADARADVVKQKKGIIKRAKKEVKEVRKRLAFLSNK